MFRRPRRRTRSASGSRTDRRCGPQGPGRKVRAPQGRTLGNTQEGRPSDSATESKPPPPRGGVRVKRWGKSPPDAAVTRHARHTPFGARPNREGGRPDHCLPGRLLEGAGNCAPRGMTVWCGQPHDRTRLIVRLPLVNKVCNVRKFRHIICCGKTLGAHTGCRTGYAYGRCHWRHSKTVFALAGRAAFLGMPPAP